jgi:hypothetical protein
MAGDETTSEDQPPAPGDDLRSRLDTVAGAVAHIAGTHTDLLGQVAEMEHRRARDAAALATEVQGLHAAVERQRDDLALALDVLARMAEALERTEARTDDRLAAVRDAATTPVADLQQMLTARSERTDAQLAAVAEAVDGLGPHPAPPDLAPVLEKLDELSASVAALTWQLPELAGASDDDPAAVAQAAEALGDRLTAHTDQALAGTLRVLDARLAGLRDAITTAAEPAPGAMGGFEAGAVMGAAQAAWNRLEQRLDHEFDDLGRQLQAMASLIEQAVESAEAAATRPVVTGDQLRKAATSVKDTVVSASRSRRARRGGPRSLGSGDGDPGGSARG